MDSKWAEDDRQLRYVLSKRTYACLKRATVNPSPLPYPSPAESNERHLPTCDSAWRRQILAVVAGASITFMPPATAALVSPLLSPYAQMLVYQAC